MESSSSDEQFKAFLTNIVFVMRACTFILPFLRKLDLPTHSPSDTRLLINLLFSSRIRNISLVFQIITIQFRVMSSYTLLIFDLQKDKPLVNIETALYEYQEH